MKKHQPTTSTSTSKISKRELKRRIAAFKARGVSRVAGPDHPIYRGGLQMTAIRFMQAPSPPQPEPGPEPEPEPASLAPSSPV